MPATIPHRNHCSLRRARSERTQRMRSPEDALMAASDLGEGLAVLAERGAGE